MSEGDKLPMDKKPVVARQSPAPSQRDAGNCSVNKYGRSTATTRKDFSGSGRPAGDFATTSRRQLPTQQPRTRYVDKRPRARGPYGVGQKEQVTNGASAPECGSVQTWGSKKSNLNHLLNFHYESRDLYNGNRWNSAIVRDGRWSGRGYGRGCVPFNKERFLQANCQFVVRTGKDYAVHAVDPDTLVDWDLIEQVRICGHEVPSCPICLFAPKAAKITRCGHIYCWPCLLHYLSLDDRTWRKCPICFEAVHEKDLKSVTALETPQYTVGDHIEMKLMKKLRGSTRVMPAINWSQDDCFPARLSGDKNTCYAKLLVADFDEIKNIVGIERKELEQELKEADESSLESSFISAALKVLEERERKLYDGAHSDKEATCENSPVVAPELAPSVDVAAAVETEQWEADDKPSPKLDKSYLSAFDEIVDQHADESMESSGDAVASAARVSQSSSDDDLSPAISFSASGDDGELQAVDEMFQGMELPQEDHSFVHSDYQSYETETPVLDDAFYFYQAGDGQHIYMHALNVRCMVKQYGSLRHCPDTVTAKIIEMEPVTMDEDSRRRLRYLNHLPLTCEFVMAELDLQPPLVSQPILDEFADDLEKRRRNRTRKARDDKRRAYHIQAEENRKMGIDPTMRVVRSDYARLRPMESSGVAMSDMIEPTEDVLTINPDMMETAANRGARTESTSSQDSLGTLPSVPSFAQMLKAGKAKSATESWPRMQKAKESTGGRSAAGDHSDAEEYPSLVPRLQSSLSDAIQAAFDNYTKESDSAVAEPNANQMSGPTGKKKKVKKLLFSTSLPRTSK